MCWVRSFCALLLSLQTRSVGSPRIKDNVKDNGIAHCGARSLCTLVCRAPLCVSTSEERPVLNSALLIVCTQDKFILNAREGNERLPLERHGFAGLRFMYVPISRTVRIFWLLHLDNTQRRQFGSSPSLRCLKTSCSQHSRQKWDGMRHLDVCAWLQELEREKAIITGCQG